MNKLIVLEISETPIGVLQAYAKKYPKSHLAEYINTKHYCLTQAEDLPEELLYPTQTWASINTGKPFSEHKVKWFNDPKNFQDFYWAEVAAAGHSTVLISTLHSSPMKAFVDTGNYKAVIPDFFAPDSDTYPKAYMPLQSLNRNLTFSNRRTTSTKQTLLTAIKHFIRAPHFSRWGLGLKSFRDMIPLSLDVIKNPESLRKLQFPLMMQIFFNEVEKNKPVLAIAGTNHIASAMHRYLHASPDIDSAISNVYDSNWLDKHDNEVMSAMHLLDRWVSYIDDLATKNNYAVAMISSMGQQPNKAITPEYLADYQYDYRLQDHKKFFSALGIDIDECTQVGAMIPQYAFQAKSLDAAKEMEKILLGFSSDSSVNRYGHYTQPNILPDGEGTPLTGILYSVDRNQDIVTVSIMLKPEEDQIIKIGDKRYNFAELGFERFPVGDHHSGTHLKTGVLLFNKKFKEINGDIGESIDYLEVSKLFKKTIGI